MVLRLVDLGVDLRRDEAEDFPRLDPDSRSTPIRRRRADEPLRDPVLLRDGRRLHRFDADEIPGAALPGIERQMDQARSRRVVLVADGLTPVVVEPWLSRLLPEILAELRDHAGGVIAVLRGESRRRTGEVMSGEIYSECDEDDRP